jgi:hypothetical protein
MKQNIIIVLLVLTVLVTHSASARPPMQTGQPIAPGGSLTVTCSGGGLSVKATNSNTFVVSCPAAAGATATAQPAATATAVPGATATPVPPTIVPPAATGPGIWISPEDLADLPMSGPAWAQVSAVANGNLGTANISDQDSMHDVNTFATALVAMRTGNAALREKAAAAIMSAIGTEDGGRTLALGRNLISYVLAADVIGLKTFSPSRDATFRAWLSAVRRETLDGRTLISTHEDRPNNWGTMAGASRIAAALYLGDTTDLNRAALVFHGFVGNRSAYSGFTYGDLSWQCTASAPVGINPVCSPEKGGALPDDMRRGGSFHWPPSATGYPWGAMGGIAQQTYMLMRAGIPAQTWQDRATCRAAAYLRFLDTQFGNWWAEGNDEWVPHLLNRICGTSYPEIVPAHPGTNGGWTDFTHTQ